MTKLTGLLSALVLAGNVAALDPIVMKGSKFFFQNGTQFFIKGIAYQQDTAAAGGESKTGTFIDPLADVARCREDIPIMAAAGTNTIRTYAIDPTADHAECMRLLQQAGIYVISDLGVPRESINRDNPQWTTALFDRYKAVVDELGKYDNVIGFLAGNEVSNNKTNTECSAFVKAAVRDTKKYIKDKGTRWMGVGYAANDDPDIRIDSAHYFNCGPEDSAIDFWGYNIYSWCGDSSFQRSGYDKQVDFFANYSVPVFLAEYGCNTVGGAEGRLFQDTTVLYSQQMTGVFSGGIVYMYFQEQNDYGLVKVSGGKAQTMKNYDVLASRVLEAAPVGTPMSQYQPSNKPAACPAVSETWEVNGDALPPTPDSKLCECMYQSLTCTPKDSLDVEDYGAIFGFVCGASGNPCSGISTNPATGVYGAYSMCSDKQKLGYVMNEYFKLQKQVSSACDHKGAGQIVTPARAQAGCDSALQSASSINSVVATATGAPQGGKPSNVAGAMRMERVFSLGDFAVGVYLLVAMGVGAGMVML